MTGPVILRLVVSAVVIMAAVSVSARRQDSISIDTSIHVARSAITAVADGLQSVAMRQALRDAPLGTAGGGPPDWLRAIIRPPASPSPQVTSGLVIDGKALDDPSAAELTKAGAGGLGLLLERARSGASPDREVAKGLMKLEGRVHVAAAAPLRRPLGDGTQATDDSPPVLVLARGLDHRLLDRIGAGDLLRG